MKLNFSRFRNSLLTGKEKHPWDHHYQVRRCDVQLGLKIIVNVKTFVANGVPQIWKDSQLEDALANPSKYQWSGQGIVRMGTVKMVHLSFTSSPFLKDEHWYAKAIDENTGLESEYSLFSLGIVPDYIFNPKRNGIDPAGWNADSQSWFNNWQAG